MEEPTNFSFLTKLKKFSESFFKLIGDITELASLEAQLARKSFSNILGLLFILGSLLTASWISILALILATLLYFHLSLIAALAVICAFNLILLCAVGSFILKLKQHLYFKATRKQLNIFQSSKERSNESAIVKNQKT